MIKHFKKQIIPFLVTYFFILFFEVILSKSDFLSIALTLFWKQSFIFILLLKYITYFKVDSERLS